MKSKQAMRLPGRAQGFAAGRFIVWLALAAWGFISWGIAGPLSADMRSRINDLAVIPGAGEIVRDPTGVFYHVNTSGMARAVFPELTPPIYNTPCLECTHVSGEQLSQTNDFCVSGVRKTLPELQFEIPCQTWSPISETRKVTAVGLFVVPVAVLWFAFKLAGPRRKKKSSLA